MTRRFQFSVKWLFAAMLLVATFFGGMAVQRKLDEPVVVDPGTMTFLRGGRFHTKRVEMIELRDGTKWQRMGEPAD